MTKRRTRKLTPQEERVGLGMTCYALEELRDGRTPVLAFADALDEFRPLLAGATEKQRLLLEAVEALEGGRKPSRKARKALNAFILELRLFAAGKAS